MNNSTIALLKELSEAPGVPGHEDAIRAIAKRELAGLPATLDRLGSISFEKKGTAPSPRIMLPGHMDEIGFLVKLIDPRGFLRFWPLGGWLPHVLPGHRVLVHGSRGPLPGLVGFKPPHIVPADKRKEMPDIKDLYIDIGAESARDAEKMGVRVGDTITPDAPFVRMGLKGRFLVGKAWDNRMAVALFIETLRALAKVKHPNTVYGVGTVQEEVGLRGATTAAHLMDPDVCIVFDTAVPADTPDMDSKESQTAMGKGPVISVLDSGMIPNPRLKALAIEVARKNRIPYQLGGLVGGMTDGSAVQKHKTGVPGIWIGPPIRYIHSHSGVLHMTDFDNTVKLAVALVQRLDAKTVAGLVG